MAPRSRQPSLAEALIPTDASLESLREAAAGSQACDLYRLGTQTVCGLGAISSELMLVGEQPGDREDREGQPFVGPAGQVLDRALAEAGIDRDTAYVTNVVKHFKWEPARGGKVRLHKSPNASEQAACRPWLQAELDVVEPRVLVAVGATAAKSLLGASFRVTADRGRFLDSDLAPHVVATVHPSSILRAEPDMREAAMTAFTDDLRVVATVL